VREDRVAEVVVLGGSGRRHDAGQCG